MGKLSKENQLLELFYNEPTRHWHFNEIVKTIKISQDRAAHWLKKFQKEELIKRIKERGKMPYFTGNVENPEYQSRKRIYAMQMLHKSGLLNYLSEIKNVHSVILFGSMTRWDWHKESDIDLFIYGRKQELNFNPFERILHREIQIFYAHDRKDFEKMGEGLIKNIILGEKIQGDLSFITVGINATITP